MRDVVSTHCDAELYTLKLYFREYSAEGMGRFGAWKKQDSSAVERFIVEVRNAHQEKWK